VFGLVLLAPVQSLGRFSFSIFFFRSAPVRSGFSHWCPGAGPDPDFSRAALPFSFSRVSCLLLRATRKNLCFDLVLVLVLPLFFWLGILLPEQVRFPINVSFCLLLSDAHRTRCAASSPAPSLIFSAKGLAPVPACEVWSGFTSARSTVPGFDARIFYERVYQLFGEIHVKI
jgi:hypothetical protein